MSKFKVGDKVQLKSDPSHKYTVTYVGKEAVDLLPEGHKSGSKIRFLTEIEMQPRPKLTKGDIVTHEFVSPGTKFVVIELTSDQTAKVMYLGGPLKGVLDNLTIDFLTVVAS